MTQIPQTLKKLDFPKSFKAKNENPKKGTKNTEKDENTMSRLESLKAIFEKIDEDTKVLVMPLVEEVIYIEGRLEELKKLPHIRVHPKNPLRQETTAAGKLYKETLQQYSNCVKVLLSTLSRYSQEEEDEFEKWIRENT